MGYIKMINKWTGSEMYVDESRLDEYSLFVYLSIAANGMNVYFMHVLTFAFYPTPPFCLVTYIDEDENEILELSSNETFLVMLKIPEECVSEEELPDMLEKRVSYLMYCY